MVFLPYSILRKHQLQAVTIIQVAAFFCNPLKQISFCGGLSPLRIFEPPRYRRTSCLSSRIFMFLEDVLLIDYEGCRLSVSGFPVSRPVEQFLLLRLHHNPQLNIRSEFFLM
jgi:hypothetical protein